MTLIASTLQSNSTHSVSATTLVFGGVKMWINFNSVDVLTRDDYNVSSWTDVSAGIATVYFSNAMTDGDYTVGNGNPVSSDGLGVIHDANFSCPNDTRLSGSTQTDYENSTGAQLDGYGIDIAIQGRLT